MSAAPPTIQIVDPYPVVRAGLQVHLEHHCGGRVVAAVPPGPAAIEEARALVPDIAVVDNNPPTKFALTFLEVARQEGLPTRVLVICDARDPAAVRETLEAGAWAYVARDAALEVMAAAALALVKGRRYVDPSLMASVLHKDEADSLSGREREVLQLVADGLRNRAIAERLDLGEETIKSHLASIMRKLGATSRAAAVATGMRRSIIA